MNSSRLGLVSVSFRSHTPEEILQAMKKADLSCIEWGSDVHAPFEDIEKVRRLASLQKDYDVSCCSYGSYFRIGVSPLCEIERMVSAARILGTNIIRLWAGNEGSAAYTDQKKKDFFDLCRKIAAYGEKNGIVFCLECHNGTFTDTKEGAWELMQAVNSRWLRMYWQPNQYQSVQENLAYAAFLAPYTEHIHVFHWKADLKLPLAEGTDLWKQYLNCFENKKTLLLEFMPDGDIRSLKAEAATLRKIVGE